MPALLLGAGIIYPVENFTASLITGMGIGMAIGYVIILARKFTINQSNSTYGADVDGGWQQLGPLPRSLIILSAMGASIPIGIGSLLGALLFTSGRSPSRAAPFWGHAVRDLLPHRPGLIQGRLFGGIQRTCLRSAAKGRQQGEEQRRAGAYG